MKYTSTFLLAGFIILSTQIRTTKANKKWTGSETLIHKTSPEAEKYSSLLLPHTIFAPDGRLYNIEKVAKETCDARDVTSSLAVAIQFGKKENGVESVIVISTRPCSDFLLDSYSREEEALDTNNGKLQSTKERVNNNNDDATNDSNIIHDKDEFVSRLWSHPMYSGEEDVLLLPLPSMPLCILPSHLVVATGGSAADAMSLCRKILEIALELSREHDNVWSTHRIRGTITASMLAKKVANHLQLPTQSAVVGRMLASAALVIGWEENHNVEWRRNERKGGGLSIWRCDPTGQFWNCYAAAVGRGAGGVEAEIMSCVARSLVKGRGDTFKDVMDLEELVAIVSPRHVQDYVSNLSFDDAVILACQCIKKSLGLSKQSGERIVHQYGVQGVLLHSNSSSSSSGGGGSDGSTSDSGECGGIRRELIYSDILCEAFDAAVTEKER
jgi:20S proteasome alpha/beta subunit